MLGKESIKIGGRKYVLVDKMDDFWHPENVTKRRKENKEEIEISRDTQFLNIENLPAEENKMPWPFLKKGELCKLRNSPRKGL